MHGRVLGAFIRRVQRVNHVQRMCRPIARYEGGAWRFEVPSLSALDAVRASAFACPCRVADGVQAATRPPRPQWLFG